MKFGSRNIFYIYLLNKNTLINFNENDPNSSPIDKI